MASILKIGDTWRAQVRRKGHKSMLETFPTKTLAIKWAWEVEGDMYAMRFKDVRGLANVTLKKLIDRYTEEVGTARPFGKNKTAVLAAWVQNHSNKALSELTDEYLTEFVRTRRKGDAGGVTIAIDLTYLASVFKTAKELWKMPISLDPINTARANMAHLKISTRSIERTRRPTAAELEGLQNYLDKHSTLPMRDIIDFAVESAMRVDEITKLRWTDLNEDDRTIVIRNRKHRRQKVGNDQEVPLLGKTFEIVKRQPKPIKITEDSRIFPVKTATITTIFPRAKTPLKIVDLHFHNLRHEGVYRLLSKDIESNRSPSFQVTETGKCEGATAKSKQKIYISKINFWR